MNKRDNFDYFTSYERQAGYALELVLNLRSAIQAGELGTRELMDALHTVENDADKVNHDIQGHLLSDFVVPFERGGMSRLAHALDDVSDAVEEVAISAYCYGVASLGQAGMAMVDMLAEAADELRQSLVKLSNDQQSGKATMRHLVRVQALESECDRAYIECVHDMYAAIGGNSESRHAAKTILAAIEAAMDALENAAEGVEALLQEAA